MTIALPRCELLGLSTGDPDSRFLAKPFTPAQLVQAVDALIAD